MLPVVRFLGYCVMSNIFCLLGDNLCKCNGIMMWDMNLIFTAVSSCKLLKKSV